MQNLFSFLSPIWKKFYEALPEKWADLEKKYNVKPCNNEFQGKGSNFRNDLTDVIWPNMRFLLHPDSTQQNTCSVDENIGKSTVWDVLEDESSNDFGFFHPMAI